MKRFLLMTAVMFLLAGCESLPKRDPDFAPVQPADLRPPVQNSGSIYQAGYDMRLFEDITARRVGDILTITLDETTQASKDTSSKTGKTSSFETSGSAPSLFGVASKAVLGNDLSTSAKYSMDRSTDGSGSADQSNSLKGEISVTVVEVIPNGNLKVRGEKRVTLNTGDEYIRISGIVRPIDIDASNKISSNQVADATVMYTGEGALADTSKIGWFSRVLNSPFFPF